MIREFLPRDAAPLMAHYREAFPEDAYLETNVPEMERLMRRSFGPLSRFVLRMSRWLGRPILRLYVVEENGGMAGTALVTFEERAGYVALVQVLPEYRRRGMATQLLDACAAAIRQAHRRYMVLEVLESNGPGRALYARLGFEQLGARQVMTREADSPGTPSPAVAGLRPLARSDGAPLSVIARHRASSAELEVMPPKKKQFFVRPFVAQALASETAAWVAPASGPPAGFVRATVSRIMGASHMTAPVIGDGLTPDLARALVDQAVAWNFERHARRVLCEISVGDTVGRALLESAGFRPAYGTLTLYRPVSA